MKNKQVTLAGSGFEKYAKTTRRAQFLADMERVVPWTELCALIEPVYPKGDGNGRPPIPLERMLRVYFLQHWFNLSDPAVEEALYESASMRAFAGVDLGCEPAPDETTVCKFRHLLERNGLGTRLFQEVGRYLQRRGMKVSSGTIVDATIINAPSNPIDIRSYISPRGKPRERGGVSCAYDSPMTGESIRVAVLGAGAVGCFFGGMLARAGHEVTLIGRQAHVDAFRKSGLRFEGIKVNENIAVRASTEAEAVRGARLVLFCVKSTDTEAGAAQIAPFLDAGAVVVNLQNGVDNTERIQARVSQPVIPAVVYVATEMAGPGRLKHHGRGDLVIGALDSKVSAEALAQVKQWFEAAGVAVAISDNVAGELWLKLVVNCAYNAISAIAQLPYGRMIQGAGVRDVMRDVVEEALAVAKASGVKIASGTLARIYAIADAMPAQYSSTAQDLARGKPTEIDHLNGYLVRRGEALGVPTPANRVLYALVKLVEAKARAYA